MKHNGYTNSRTSQVRQYFANNPDEYLTFSDIATKFNCTEKQARIVVMQLKRLGSVQTALVVHKAPEEV